MAYVLMRVTVCVLYRTACALYKLTSTVAYAAAKGLTSDSSRAVLLQDLTSGSNDDN